MSRGKRRVRQPFAEASVGERVFSILYGWGRISSVRSDGIFVRFPVDRSFIELSYEFTGKEHTYDAMPSLYYAVPKITEQPRLDAAQEDSVDDIDILDDIELPVKENNAVADTPGSMRRSAQTAEPADTVVPRTRRRAVLVDVPAAPAPRMRKKRSDAGKPRRPKAQ